MKIKVLNLVLFLIPVLGTSQIYVPNSFTPNNDGLNDYWQVSVGDSLINNYSCQIVNRDGKVIWQSFDPQDKWLGGEEYYSPNGIYQYIVIYNSKKYYGSVFILR
jgi:gliding motility-associated-like protein